MQHFRNTMALTGVAVILLWALTAPGWFARGALGRAMTNLDIWAQIHLPYPVLTLMLMGVIVTCAVLWFRRHIANGRDHKNLWAHKS